MRLAGLAGFGDLDADASPDAAVVLIGSGGGSGTFVELTAVHNDHGAAAPIATALLGDRVLVREVSVAAGVILVRLRARGATDPLSLRTREVTRHYALRGGALVMLDESETEVPTTPVENFAYRPERIDLVPGATREVRGVLAPGQIASYVIHGTTADVLELAAVSEFDNAVLSISGLTDAVTLVSRRDYAARTTLQLRSEQDYAVKVVSLAGYPFPFTLEARLGASSASPSPTPRISPVPLPSRTPAPLPSRSGPLQRPLGEASREAETYALTRPPIWGVAVAVPSSGVVYAENADTQVPTASIVKVLVLLNGARAGAPGPSTAIRRRARTALADDH